MSTLAELLGKLAKLLGDLAELLGEFAESQFTGLQPDTQGRVIHKANEAEA